MNTKGFIKQAQQLVADQNKWRGTQCINLIASENVMSPLARSLYVSDFMHRYAEGLVYHRYYNGTKYADEIEDLCIKLMKRVFKVKRADVRPLSGAGANMAVLAALTQAGDKFMNPGVPAGTHISQEWFGCAGIRGLNVSHYAYDSKDMCIDVDKTAQLIRKTKPKLIGLGASVFTFPHPVKELKEVANEVGAQVWYDAAHVAGLIAAGLFQDPFREGADVVTISTHKTFPGPQGGAVLANNLDEKIWKKIEAKIFPGTVSNHHLHKLASLAVTCAEFLKYGKAYSKQTVRNAKVLAGSLYDKGFKVLWPERGFTQSHLFVVDVVDYGGGKIVADQLERANIILNKNLLPYDDVNNAENPSGIRIGTPEMTHFGMKESEMKIIAKLIKRVVIDKERPEKVKKDVIELRKQFQKVRYCFE